MVDWSTLPKDLLGLIAVRLFCVVDLLRFHSVCRSWRSSVSGIADGNHLPNHNLNSINPLVVTIQGNEPIHGLDRCTSVSRAVFFRVAISSSSSSSSQGWLIKSNEEIDYGTFRLLNPLSGLPLRHWYKSIDLLKFNVSGIQEAYEIQDRRTKKTSFGFKRLVLGGDHRVIGVGCDGRIRYWNREIWTRIKDQIDQFSDIIIHNGIT